MESSLDIKVAYDVQLTLSVVDGDCTEDGLDELAIIVLEAVQDHARHIAGDAVVVAVYDHPGVELDFTIEAAHPSELYEGMTTVTKAIEENTPVAFVQASHTQPAERELAGAC